jgi:hypothetical protein
MVVKCTEMIGIAWVNVDWTKSKYVHLRRVNELPRTTDPHRMAAASLSAIAAAWFSVRVWNWTVILSGRNDSNTCQDRHSHQGSRKTVTERVSVN